MLGHGYGATTRVLSSYAFDDIDAGPPMDANQNIISPIINAVSICYFVYFGCKTRLDFTMATSVVEGLTFFLRPRDCGLPVSNIHYNKFKKNIQNTDGMYYAG